MFIVALFVIAKNWESPTCPATDKLVKQTLIYPYNGVLPSNKEESTR